MGQGTGRAGTPPEQLRFGVVLNGGVSLAVWMGGAVLELDRLTRARDTDGRRPAGADPVYAELLELAGCVARADVIAGTSAGGINGAALALSQVNSAARLDALREIWLQQGRIESLLRQPFQGSPTSLLKGDEYFLPKLHAGLSALTAGTEAGHRDPVTAPVDLTITTTVLDGTESVTVDSLGQAVPQTVHAGRFHWRRPAEPCPDQGPEKCRDPFCPRHHLEHTAERLALAARSSASFPIAFEPVFVPVGAPDGHRSPGSTPTEEQRLRPDMGSHASWTCRGTDRSRYVVDGGLLANTPVREALEAIERMPFRDRVRRVVLLVHPHAGLPGAETAATRDAPPSVAETVTGLLGALTAQGGRSYVEQLELHNRAAAGRRGTRTDVLRDATPTCGPPELVGSLYPAYRRLRRWRAERDLATRLLDAGAGHDAWGFERIRAAAGRAQHGWLRDRSGSLPYVPDQPPRPSEIRLRRGSGWAWA